MTIKDFNQQRGWYVTTTRDISEKWNLSKGYVRKLLDENHIEWHDTEVGNKYTMVWLVDVVDLFFYERYGVGPNQRKRKTTAPLYESIS